MTSALTDVCMTENPVEQDSQLVELWFLDRLDLRYTFPRIHSFAELGNAWIIEVLHRIQYAVKLWLQEYKRAHGWGE